MTRGAAIAGILVKAMLAKAMLIAALGLGGCGGRMTGVLVAPIHLDGWSLAMAVHF